MPPSPLVILSSPRTGHERAQYDPLTNDSRRCYPQVIFLSASTSPNQPSSAYAFLLVLFSLLRSLGYSLYIKVCQRLILAKIVNMNILGSKAPINSYKLEKMTKSLTFSNEKARKELGWEPLDVLENYRV